MVSRDILARSISPVGIAFARGAVVASARAVRAMESPAAGLAGPAQTAAARQAAIAVPRWVGFFVSATLPAVIVILGWSLRHPLPPVPSIVGQAIPALSLIRLQDGSTMELRATVQGPALVHFFTTSSLCTPCAEEVPALMVLRAKGVRILGIVVRETPDSVREFLARTGNPYQDVFLGDNQTTDEFLVDGYPDTYAIDHAAIVRGRHGGPLTLGSAGPLLVAAGR